MTLGDNDIQEHFWFHEPREVRLESARIYARLGLESLFLGMRAHNCLMRSKLYPDVAALMLAGEEIWSIRNLGIGTVREIHSALVPLFARARELPVDASTLSDAADEGSLAEIHLCLVTLAGSIVAELVSRDRWLAALTALADRHDLTEHELADLGWPEWLIAASPGSSLGSLTSLAPDEAAVFWGGLLWQPSKRESLILALEELTELPMLLDDEAWAEHWRAKGITVLPADFSTGGGVGMVAAVEQVLHQVMIKYRNETDWTILKHRYGLAGAEEFTLDDLGTAFGLTRERIRQREVRALKTVKAGLAGLDAPGAPARVHPAIARSLMELGQFFEEVRGHPLRARDFVQRAHAIVGTRGADLNPLVAMLASLYGIKPIPLNRNGLEDIWTCDDKALRLRISKPLQQLHEFLTSETSEAFSEVALTVALNRRAKAGEKLTLPELLQYIDLCSTIERLPDGRYRGRFDALATRSMQMERILLDAGEPLHLADILRTLNQQVVMAGGKPVKRLNLGNQFAADARFVPIGRSGLWALARWPDIETGTILVLMERCLAQHNRPMTAQEIYAWIAERRPVSEGSILAYLTTDDDFGQVDRERWGLGHWKEAQEARRWNRAGVADFVARLFAERRTKRMPYETVRDALAEVADATRRVANGYLATNPVIDTTRGPDGALFAELQPNYRLQLDEESGHRRPAGLILDAVLHISQRALAAHPGREMPLGALRDILMEELNIPSATVYSYVSRLPQLETLPAPDGHGKLVRLIAVDGTSAD